MIGFSHPARLQILMPCILLAAAATATPAFGQEQPINTERPSFSSSPIALDPGVLQLEGGYEYLRDDNGVEFDASRLPLLLVRYGLAEKLELQVGWAGYTWAEAGNRDIDGTGDASVGMKWQITEDGAQLPVSLFAGVSVPVGAKEFSSDRFDPTIGAFWSYSAALDWFGTVLVSQPDDETVLSNALGISLPLSERLGSYVEYYGNYGDSGPEHYVNGGVTYLSALSTQFDAHIGLGLNDRSADLLIGFGLAHRF